MIKKYLTIEEWAHFKENHWRHLTWKVHSLIGIEVITLGVLVALFCALLEHMTH